MTVGPASVPASAYPILRRPALICFNDPNDVFVPGLIGGTLVAFVMVGCASAGPIVARSATATVMAALRKKRRRSYLISSDNCLPPIPASCQRNRARQDGRE